MLESVKKITEKNQFIFFNGDLKAGNNRVNYINTKSGKSDNYYICITSIKNDSNYENLKDDILELFNSKEYNLISENESSINVFKKEFTFSKE